MSEISISKHAQKLSSDYESNLEDHDESLKSPYFSERLRAEIEAIRRTRKLSMADFAKIIGFSRQYVHMVETGQNVPSLDYVDQIDRVFGVWR